MIIQKQPWFTNRNPSKADVPKSTTWVRAIGSFGGSLSPRQHVPSPPYRARAPRGQWRTSKEMVVLSVEHQDTQERFCGNAEKRGNAPRNPDANVVTGTFLLNNHYALSYSTWLTDRSFISTAFSSLINIAPTSLENCYDVELADGKLVEIDTIIRGCTLNFLDHMRSLDLMP
ncbi:hypothetical protein Tco_1538424 [Tanacetum coccineum]